MAKTQPAGAARSGRKRLLIAGAFVTALLVVIAATVVTAVRWFLAPADQVTVAPDANRIAAAAPGGPDRTSAALPVISGNVIDARTQSPITSFIVITGERSAPGTEPTFDRRTARKFANGQYRQSMGGDDVDAWFVKIEALGHLPAVSPAMQSSGTADFQLQPAADVVGRVLDADGHPAVGIKVGIAYTRFASKSVYLLSDRATNAGPKTITDASGQFEFTPQTESFYVIAYGPAGFAETPGELLAKDPDVRLTPWGRLTGQVWNGGKPFAGAWIDLNTHPVGPDQKPLPVQLGSLEMGNLHADALGRFHFDQVFPGDCVVETYKDGLDRDATTQGPTQAVTVLAGQTTTTIVGDYLRDVTGGLSGPADLLARKDCTMQAYISLQPDTRPTNPQDKIQLALKLAAARRISAVGPDGSFHFSGVGPGEYDLVATLRLTATGATLAQDHSHFTVPPSALDAASAQPLDIGDVTLTSPNDLKH